MKKVFIVFLMVLFVCFHQAVCAQSGYNASYQYIEFSHDKENVYVSIYFNSQGYYVESGDSLTLIPLIRAHTNTLELPKVVLIGQGQQGFYLHNPSHANISPYSHPQVSSRINDLYQVTVPYKPWMDNSRLDLKVDLNRIGGFPLHSYAQVLKNSIRAKAPDMQMPLISAKTEYNADPHPQTEDIFSNPAGPARKSIAFDLRLSAKKSFVTANLEEINKIRTLIDWAMTNPNVSLTGVYITAYTSVDGIYMDNLELTKEQALAFKRILQAENNFPEALFFTEWKGEDWPGLTELVKHTNMPYRQEVLDIINNTGVFTGRELKLMQLAQGNPYRYMRDNLFHQQWRIECRVVYRNN
ncbi:DUF3868 domain-containing protein [Dysgonomonas sp. GY75]|uniref:DUF3868 domain-containing protein n=1 Tax=Dysgonomonas sp. GY75 TaxID=2780419 RepID=UPI001883B6F5|nr:DUF3868 domain-containing protein [Dysgonomonas sp. GY75]MBF0647961.1 DUF3868 domain-containing protein [Dysgonomonas sp. GY75]